MQKRITFTNQSPYPNPLDARRKLADIILREMRNSDFQLQGVNIPSGTMPQTGSRRYWRTKCDTCVLTEGGGDKEKCVEKIGTGYNVCTNCYNVYERPCCSWTPDIYNRQAFVRGTATDSNRVRITDIATHTLVIQPRAEATNQSYDPLLQELVDMILEEQATSKNELEQEWGEPADDEFDPKDGEWWLELVLEILGESKGISKLVHDCLDSRATNGSTSLHSSSSDHQRLSYLRHLSSSLFLLAWVWIWKISLCFVGLIDSFCFAHKVNRSLCAL